MLLAALATRAALAQSLSGVPGAVAAYQARDFVRARDAFQTVLDRRELLRADRGTVRGYLAACHHALGDADRAKEALRALFEEDAAAAIDSSTFAPSFVQLAERVRAEVARPSGPPAGGPTGSFDPPAARPGPSEGPVEVALVHRATPLSFALIPFGVGQFANDDSGKAVFFLAAESIAFITFGVSLALFEGKKMSGTFLSEGTFRQADLGSAYALHSTYLIAFWSGVAVAVWGVIDAVVSRRPVFSSLWVAPGAAVARF